MTAWNSNKFLIGLLVLCRAPVSFGKVYRVSQKTQDTLLFQKGKRQRTRPNGSASNECWGPSFSLSSALGFHLESCHIEIKGKFFQTSAPSLVWMVSLLFLKKKKVCPETSDSSCDDNFIFIVLCTMTIKALFNSIGYVSKVALKGPKIVSCTQSCVLCKHF